MPPIQSDYDDFAQRLLQDVGATLGTPYETIVPEIGRHVRECLEGADGYRQRVVEDVQQWVHDNFVDTTWPRCPRHGNHPLWFREGAWWCEQDSQAVARLGELGKITTAGETRDPKGG